MDISNKTDRTQLKKYFAKNSIPTESNFKELIEGMLNQSEDRIVKLPGEPLSIEANGDATSLKKLINFYQSLSDSAAAWMLNLNARVVSTATPTAGFSLSDGQGISRLFIDPASGNIGIGTVAPFGKLQIQGSDHQLVISNNIATTDTSKKDWAFTNWTDNKLYLQTWNNGTTAKTAKNVVVFDTTQGVTIADALTVGGAMSVGGALSIPSGNVGIGTSTSIAKLDIAQTARTATHPSAVKGLYVTGDFGYDQDGVEFRHSNGSQGIGIGYAGIYATGSNADQHIYLKPRGNGAIMIEVAQGTWAFQNDGNICFTNRHTSRVWCMNSSFGDFNGIRAG